MTNFIKVNGEIIPVTAVESVCPFPGTGIYIRLTSGRHMSIPVKDVEAKTNELLTALGWNNLVMDLNNND